MPAGRPNAAAAAADDEVRIENPVSSGSVIEDPAIGLPASSEPEPEPAGESGGGELEVDASTSLGRVEEGMPRWFDWQVTFLKGFLDHARGERLGLVPRDRPGVVGRGQPGGIDLRHAAE